MPKDRGSFSELSDAILNSKLPKHETIDVVKLVKRLGEHLSLYWEGWGSEGDDAECAIKDARKFIREHGEDFFS